MTSGFDFDLSAGSSPTLAAPAGPIADLSYRSYDGPLLNRSVRWWVVALANIRPLRKRGWFWALVALSAFPYLFAALEVYSRAKSAGLNSLMGGGEQPRFATYFFNALDGQAFFLLVLALFVGAGVIAADNRANALQVYLARPISRADYLAGKWMSVFLPLYVVALAPALVLYLFCLLSFTHDFWREDRLLILRLLLATAIPGAIHTSLLTGFSAWSKTPRMAGAIYAGFYLVSVVISGIAVGFQTHGDMSKRSIAGNLSVPGIINGLTQSAYHVVIHFQGFHRRRMVMQSIDIHPPNIWIMLAAAAFLVIAGIAAAQAKIRAVEVVRG